MVRQIYISSGSKVTTIYAIKRLMKEIASFGGSERLFYKFRGLLYNFLKEKNIIPKFELRLA